MTTAFHRIGANERRALTLVFAWSAAALFVLYLVFVQLRQRDRKLEEQIRGAERTVSGYEARVEGRTLAERIDRERRRRDYLLDEWKRYSNLLEIWRTRDSAENGEPVEAARIDFKVALFNARERLTQRAREIGTLFPNDIGIGETIETDEDTAVRLLQLAAVQRLVGIALDLNLPEILEIRALPPEPVPAADGGREYLDRYPIRLRVRCSMSAFAQFLAQVMRAQHFFTVAHVFAEKNSKTDPDLLDVTVVFNALVLKEEQP